MDDPAVPPADGQPPRTGEAAKPLDRRPFLWALAVVGLIAAGVLAFQFAGRQRLHNTALWQLLHPVTRVSPPQTATPVQVVEQRLQSYAVVQTEKGLYFLSGTRHVPGPGSQVVVQSNARWDLFLCAEDGTRCMSIHSFCAERRWPDVKRDAEGRLEGCHAPRALDTPAAVPDAYEPPRALPGGMGKERRLAPPQGMSHPRDWAWRMGLPE